MGGNEGIVNKVQNTEEKLLRFVKPELYRKMAEVFSDSHIHPYDVLAKVREKEDGLEVTIRFAANFSEILTTVFSFQQAEDPDEQVASFFKEAALKCKSLLIADYYKMIKL